MDSILVDEARTPLIISGRVADTARWYQQFSRIADTLRRDEHYEVDEAKRQVITTEEGVERVEKVLGVENMYDHHGRSGAPSRCCPPGEGALSARRGLPLDHGEVKIVDEFTGRVLEGRRYSEAPPSH